MGANASQCGGKCWKPTEEEEDVIWCDEDGDPLRGEGSGIIELGKKVWLYEEEKVKQEFDPTINKLMIPYKDEIKWKDDYKQYCGLMHEIREMPHLGIVGLACGNNKTIIKFPTQAIEIKTKKSTGKRTVY